MTTEKNYGDVWRENNADIARNLNAELEKILGHGVRFSLIIWPEDGVTLYAGTEHPSLLKECLMEALGNLDFGNPGTLQ